ncbi:MAG: sigma-70 family RNA polymerase sigma factor [Akkermansiaceae bacterium]
MITEEQFIRLFVDHEAEFRGFARSLMLHSAEADDLMQEASIAMWRKISTLKNEQVFRSWGYSYLRLTAMNMRRKRKRSPLLFSDKLMEVIADEGTEEAELAAAERDALEECLTTLPENQGQLIREYYASRITAAELSERMHRSIDGIYKALERTRAALRECIGTKIEQAGFYS